MSDLNQTTKNSNIHLFKALRDKSASNFFAPVDHTPFFQLTKNFVTIDNEGLENLLSIILPRSHNTSSFHSLRLWQRILNEPSFADQFSENNQTVLLEKAAELGIKTLVRNQPMIYQVIGAHLLKIAEQHPKLKQQAIIIASHNLNYQPAKILLLQQEVQQQLQQRAFDQAIKIAEENAFNFGEAGIKLAVAVFEEIAQYQLSNKDYQIYCYYEALKYSLILQEFDKGFAENHIKQNRARSNFTPDIFALIEKEAAMLLSTSSPTPPSTFRR